MAEKREETEFFKRLRLLMSDKGLSQASLSKATDIDKGTISRWRNSDNPPSIGSIYKICEVTGCSLEWLRNGEGPMFKHQPPPGDQINFDFKTPKPKAEQPIPPVSEEAFDMPDMVKMTMEILASGTVYRSALVSNIRAFHKAVNMEKEMNEVRQEISSIRKENHEMAERMARMEEMLLSLGATLPEKRDKKAM